MDFMTTKQAAALWNISQRRVSLLCEQGRIPGVQKIGIFWLIPPNADRPADLRYSKNRQETRRILK